MSPLLAGNLLLDSSVLVKWFSPEVDHQLARRLRSGYLEGKCELAIPDLALYELANALRYSGRFKSREIAEHVRSIIELEVAILPFNLAVLGAAIDLSLQKDTTVYDSYFVALAEATGMIFVTADARLFRRIQDLGFVTLLRNLIANR